MEIRAKLSAILVRHRKGTKQKNQRDKKIKVALMLKPENFFLFQLWPREHSRWNKKQKSSFIFIPDTIFLNWGYDFNKIDRPRIATKKFQSISLNIKFCKKKNKIIEKVFNFKLPTPKLDGNLNSLEIAKKKTTKTTTTRRKALPTQIPFFRPLKLM